MITKNWYKYFGVYFGFKEGAYTAKLNVKDVAGNVHNPSYNASSSLDNLFRGPEVDRVCTTKSSYGLHFGDGTVAPTEDDYYLSGAQITTISKINVDQTHGFNDNTKHFYNVATYTVKNTGTEPVTVSELAWVGYFYNGSGKGIYCMLDRTLLDEPVTIAAGDYGLIRYTMGVTLPADKLT